MKQLQNLEVLAHFDLASKLKLKTEENNILEGIKLPNAGNLKLIYPIFQNYKLNDNIVLLNANQILKLLVPKINNSFSPFGLESDVQSRALLLQNSQDFGFYLLICLMFQARWNRGIAVQERGLTTGFCQQKNSTLPIRILSLMT